MNTISGNNYALFLLVQSLSAVVMGFVTGIAGLAIGMFIGGNFGFPSVLGKTAGYESGGLFFWLLCFPLGIGLGMFIGCKFFKTTINTKLLLLGGLLALVAGFVLAAYDVAALGIIFWLPVLLMLLVENLPRLSGLSK